MMREVLIVDFQKQKEEDEWETNAEFFTDIWTRASKNGHKNAPLEEDFYFDMLRISRETWFMAERHPIALMMKENRITPGREILIDDGGGTQKKFWTFSDENVRFYVEYIVDYCIKTLQLPISDKLNGRK